MSKVAQLQYLQPPSIQVATVLWGGPIAIEGPVDQQLLYLLLVCSKSILGNAKPGLYGV